MDFESSLGWSCQSLPLSHASAWFPIHHQYLIWRTPRHPYHNLVVSQLCSPHNIMSSTITIGCDNQEALCQFCSVPTYVSSTTKYADLSIGAIHATHWYFPFWVTSNTSQNIRTIINRLKTSLTCSIKCASQFYGLKCTTHPGMATGWSDP